MTRKIIFLDIDGTLAGMDGQVPPSTLTACREARLHGHLLYICTGRPRAYIDAAVLAIGFDGVISAGGAYIEIGNTSAETVYRGQVIFHAEMPADLVRHITSYLTEKRCGFSLEKNNLTQPNKYLLSFWKDAAEHLNGAEGKKFSERIAAFKSNPLPDNPLESDYKHVNKIIFVTSGDISFAALARTFEGQCEVFRGSIPYAGKEGGEIGPVGVHKGSALKLIAEYHKIPLADTIAFGDSDNDRTMIERAGTGIAMGNACGELKAIADDVTTDLDDNGIFNGFRKHRLI